jgi:hypothetical protein
LLQIFVGYVGANPNERRFTVIVVPMISIKDRGNGKPPIALVVRSNGGGDGYADVS